MTLVFDASVIVKLFVNEPDRHLARAAISEHDAIAPEFCRAEVLSVLCKKVRRGEAERSQVDDALNVIDQGLIGLRSVLWLEAADLALRLEHHVYDCFYLACSIESDVPLLSADRIFIAKTKKAGYPAILLGDPLP